MVPNNSCSGGRAGEAALEELGPSARALGDPTLIAMLEKLRRVLTEGKGLDG